MKDHLEFALRTAAMLEKQSMEFYQYAAEAVSSPAISQMFRRLACEEEEHLRLFHQLYQGHDFGNLYGILNQPPDFNTAVYQTLIKLVATDALEIEALEIALREEKSCIEVYAGLVSGFKEGSVRDIFQQALFETRMHIRMIETEYLRLTTPPKPLLEHEPLPVADTMRIAGVISPSTYPKLLPGGGPKIIDAQLEED